MAIIIKKQDLGVKIVHPNPGKYGEGLKPYSECKSVQGLQPDEWFATDQVIDKSDLESRKQLYWEGTEVKKDYEWNKRLMPDQLIKRKAINYIDSEMDKEIEKSTPDVVVLMKFQRDKDKLSKIKAGSDNEDPIWIEKAIEGLDRKVADGEPDKPEIRIKLQNKLGELNAKDL
jgi:hypothetical protein